MITGALHTIATRSWVPPVGAARDARLNELREAAGRRTGLLIQVAGIILGVRVDDEHDPRYVGYTANSAMLLELPTSRRTTRRFSGGSRSVGSAETGNGSVPGTAGELTTLALRFELYYDYRHRPAARWSSARSEGRVAGEAL
jgi:hypothetical protein